MGLEQSGHGGEREEGRGGRGPGRSCRALWARERTRASTSGSWEPWRAVGRGGQDLTEELLPVVVVWGAQTRGKSAGPEWRRPHWSQ